MIFDEEQIISGLKKGDNSAYKQVFEKHYQVMCFAANSILQDPFASETIAADVISHIWEARKTLNIEAVSLRAYLLKCVSNRCIDYMRSKHYRKSKESKEPYENIVSDIMEQDNCLNSILEKELEKKIFDTIEKIPESSRKVFIMSRFDEKSRTEIADELGISINTVKYHLKKALGILYDGLGKNI